MEPTKPTIRVRDDKTKNIYGGNLYKATVMEWMPNGHVLLTIDLGLSIKTEMECKISRVSQVPEELAAYLQREFPRSTQIIVSTIPKPRAKRVYLVELWTYKLPPTPRIPVWTQRKNKYCYYSDVANINDWIISLEKS